MSQTIEAIFEAGVLRPEVPLLLGAGTRVRVTLEIMSTPSNEPCSFLQTARSLELEGPADWAANLDHYLYGEI